MSKPQVVVVALAALAVAAPAAEAQFAYSPSAQRYRLEQVVEATQEMGGQSMSNTISTTQILGVQVARAGDSLAVTFTVDSVGISTPIAAMQAQAQAEADKLIGKQVTGTLTPLGEVTSMKGPAADSAGNDEQLSSGFRNFFPRFPNSSLAAGMSWTDTTSARFANNGIDGTSTSIVTYTVEGDTTVAGKQAWRVTQKGTVTTNGMGNTQGQELALSGGGTMKGTAVVSKDGVYLGGDSSLEQSMTVQVIAMNVEVPITQSITSKVRVVE